MSNATAQIPRNHNSPPSPIEFAQSVMDDVNAFLSEHPTIQTEDEARAAKPYLDRAKAALEDIERERDRLVRPLNEQVSNINSKYKAYHNIDAKKPGLFDKILIELKARLAAHMIREEEKRRKEAEEAQRAKEEAERIAREAEAREAEALENAKLGEVVDVAAATKAADEAFNEYQRQSRFAERAEAESKVRVGGGFGRTATLRNAETLHLESYNRAIKAIGPHDGIRDAILSAAREYRKVHGHLPDGVTATTERKL